MTRFQKIVVALLSLNVFCTLGLYLRLDSQQLLIEKEVRSMKRDIGATRYDDTSLKSSLTSLQKQVGKLDAGSRSHAEEAQEQPAAKPETPAPAAPKKAAGGLKGWLQKIFR